MKRSAFLCKAMRSVILMTSMNFIGKTVIYWALRNKGCFRVFYWNCKKAINVTALCWNSTCAALVKNRISYNINQYKKTLSGSLF